MCTPLQLKEMREFDSNQIKTQSQGEKTEGWRERVEQKRKEGKENKLPLYLGVYIRRDSLLVFSKAVSSFPGNNTFRVRQV